MFEHIQVWKNEYNYVPTVVNVGGGFGIRYTETDQPLQPEEYVSAIIEEVKKQVEERNLTMPEIWIEPGRSLVGDAGTTLYKIGSRKELPGIRNYLAVDGGMSDNIRPALYQAKYDAILANKAKAEKADLFRFLESL